ncbi:MAG: hypothetical protein H8E66_32340 [Planctomycetes bacterium]|nr:hypothetical protein [Planctomycetota bacterium]
MNRSLGTQHLARRWLPSMRATSGIPPVVRTGNLVAEKTDQQELLWNFNLQLGEVST